MPNFLPNVEQIVNIANDWAKYCPSKLGTQNNQDLGKFTSPNSWSNLITQQVGIFFGLIIGYPRISCWYKINPKVCNYIYPEMVKIYLNDGSFFPFSWLINMPNDLYSTVSKWPILGIFHWLIGHTLCPLRGKISPIYGHNKQRM